MIGQRILRLEEIASTNTFLLQQPELLSQHGTVVLTLCQAAGRGRHGRSFVALAGKTLTFSIVLHPLPECDLGLIPLLAGIAVARTLEPSLSVLPELKWPNDVLIRHKKICGILCEIGPAVNPQLKPVVVGIGINGLGTSSDYPEELRHKLTTLEEESKKKGDLEELFQQFLVEFELGWQSAVVRGSDWIIKEWLHFCQKLNQPVVYQNQGILKTGIMDGITSSGHLLLRNASGIQETYASGELQFHDYRD